MTLKEWLQKKGRKQTWMAEQIGVTETYVSLIANGRRPSLSLALKIREVTGGAVDPGSWEKTK